MSLTFSEMLQQRIPIIFDGALGTEIQNHSLSPEEWQDKHGCNEILNLTRPDVIQAIHASYCNAGATVLETNTFGANRAKLAEYGLESKVANINQAAAQAARDAISSSAKSGPCFVCGVLGPTGFLPSSSDASLNKLSFDDCAEIYKEQAQALLQGNVDLLLLETMQDLLETRAALFGIRKAFAAQNRVVPIQIQVTMDMAGLMLLGSNSISVLGALANCNPTVLGLNCSTGPMEMLTTISDFVKNSPHPISMIPNAGMPKNVDGKAVYALEPTVFVEPLIKAVTEIGVSVVGGCCGTTPAHIKLLADSLANKKVAAKEKPTNTCFLTTGIGGLPLHSVKRPFLIGERLNTQGSKKTKEFVLAQNYDELYQLALEQEKRNATLLDICMATNELESESDTVTTVVRFLAERLETPFCIDSTEPAVIEAALKVCAGSLLINSINLERKGEKARAVLSLARDFGCPVIALPIDDTGMAKTVERKLALTKDIVELACNEYGLALHNLYIDPLTFTLATGDPESADAATVSLEALTKIKETFPTIQTVMGVSNVSFGLRPKARRVLNNLLLHHAGIAGLDAAIFNPLHVDDISTYEPAVKELAENLLFNKKETALVEYIEHFEKLEADSSPAPKKKATNLENLPPDQQLREKILNRDKRNLPPLLETLLANNSALDILNTMLMPAMAEVGNRLASGKMILPFVLQAAEVMREALTILEPSFKKEKIENKGKIVLATVFGDVHDIGKNLVGSILKNQGFEIIDLGKQVPLDDIITAVNTHKPRAVGLSALLVTTSQEMARCVKEFDRLGLTIPILIGGAAVNAQFAKRIEQVNDTRGYAGKVSYAKDAFEAVTVLEAMEQQTETAQPISAEPHPKKVETPKKQIPDPTPLEYGELLVPPFYGTGEILTWDVTTLLSGLKKTILYKGYWRATGMGKEAYAKASEEEFDGALDLLTNELIEKDLIEARAFYGFYPVITDDNKLILLSPSDFHQEVATFDFPRIENRQWRCFADYFRSEGDLISIQIVTIGHKLAERSRRYIQEENEYALGFYLHGLGTYLTEELADKITAEIRRGLILPKAQGRRFSFGYRGLTDLSEQKKLFDLLCIEDRMGITMTTGFQMVPEHSTLGLFVHHKEATYF